MGRFGNRQALKVRLEGDHSPGMGSIKPRGLDDSERACQEKATQSSKAFNERAWSLLCKARHPNAYGLLCHLLNRTALCLGIAYRYKAFRETQTLDGQ